MPGLMITEVSSTQIMFLVEFSFVFPLLSRGPKDQLIFDPLQKTPGRKKKKLQDVGSGTRDKKAAKVKFWKVENYGS